MHEQSMNHISLKKAATEQDMFHQTPIKHALATIDTVTVDMSCCEILIPYRPHNMATTTWGIQNKSMYMYGVLMTTFPC